MRQNSPDWIWDESQRQTNRWFESDPRSVRRLCRALLYLSSMSAILTLPDIPGMLHLVSTSGADDVHHDPRQTAPAHISSSSRDHPFDFHPSELWQVSSQLLSWTTLHLFVKMIDLQFQNLLSRLDDCRYSKQEEEESSINKYRDDDGRRTKTPLQWKD